VDELFAFGASFTCDFSAREDRSNLARLVTGGGYLLILNYDDRFFILFIVFLDRVLIVFHGFHGHILFDI
jgi:hypothetical protein